MGNLLFNEYDAWNTTSVDFCMGFLISRFNIFEYEKTKKITPISIQLYKYLDQKMDGFLAWYKVNKLDQYKPSHGIKQMYSYELINKVYLLNKSNKNIFKIIKLWNSRDPLFLQLSHDDKINFRIDMSKLPDIPNDPMILMF